MRDSAKVKSRENNPRVIVKWDPESETVLLRKGEEQSEIQWISPIDGWREEGSTQYLQNSEWTMAGNDQMTEKTIPQLTAEYNELATASGLKTVVKFRDKATAERRLNELKEKNGGTNRTAENQSQENIESPTETNKSSNEASKSSRDIVEEFNFRSPDRQRVLKVLADNFEKMVPLSHLGKSARNHVEQSIKWRIGAKKLPYEVREEKEGKDVKVGLFRRVHR